MRLHLLKFFISLSLFATSFCKQSAAQSYCTTDLYTTGCGTNWIKEVTTYTSSILPSFSHTGSGCEASSGYVNFSDLYSVVQAAGSYLEFRVVTQVGYDGGGGGAYRRLAIFVDFNDNGSFDDPGEFVYYVQKLASIGELVYEDTFYIPADAPLGPHRMRIRYSNLPIYTSCHTLDRGETHEYTLIIVDTICDVSVESTGACLGDTLFFNANTSAPNPTFYWWEPSGLFSNEQSPFIYPPSLEDNGNYHVLLLDTSIGCVNVSYLEDFAYGHNLVHKVPHPVIDVDLYGEDWACLGEEITYYAPDTTAITDEVTYAWSTDSSGVPVIGSNFYVTHAFTTPGWNTIYVTSTTEYGCSYTDSFSVFVKLQDIWRDTFYLCYRDLEEEPYFLPDYWGAVSGTPITSWGPNVYVDTGVYSGGCHYLRTLSLFPIYPDSTFIYDTLCADAFPYITEWGDTIYSAGTSIHLLPGSDTICDSVIVLHLEAIPLAVDTLVVTLCPSEYPFEWNGTLFYDPGEAVGSQVFPSSTGCDSTIYLTIVEAPGIINTDTQFICSGNSYLFIDTLLTEEGFYTKPFTSVDGCDSIYNLWLFVTPPDTIFIDTSICSGQSFEFYGTILSEIGTHNLFFLDTGDVCDVAYILHLTVNDTIRTYDTQSICSGGELVWGGTSLTEAGTYTFHGSNADGCDTLHYLTLEVEPLVSDTTLATICSGVSYPFHGSSYNTTGTYSILETSGDCDTLFVLILTVNDTIRTYDTQSICSGGELVWGGTSLTEAGTYTFYGSNADGCDTLHYLTLEVEPLVSDTTVATICSGVAYPFHGSNYNSSGTYSILETSGDCDTLFVLILTVNDTIRTYDTQSICSGGELVWGGTSLTEAGTYTFYGSNADGCDTLHYLTLEVEPLVSDTTLATICANSYFNFYGSDYNSAGYHTYLDASGLCDTLRVLYLEVLPIFSSEYNVSFCSNQLPATVLGVDIPYGTTSTSGFATVVFTALNGCDSFITINVDVRDTGRTDIDTMVCFGTVFNFGSNTISSPGVYFHTLTNVQGCDSVVALHVDYYIPPYSDDTLVSGCSRAIYNGVEYFDNTTFIDTIPNYLGCDSVWRTVHIEVLFEPKDTFYVDICQGGSYNFNGAVYSSSTVATQMYTAANGCDSTITMVLTVHPLPNVRLEIGPLDLVPDVLCVFDTIRLKGTGAFEYNYYNEYQEFLGSGDYVDILIPKPENKFWVVGTDELGCTNTFDVLVQAQMCCDILMPNAFSPNGDGLNDKFGPVTMGTPINYRMVIVDRLGRLVYESFKIEDKWEGTYSDGQPADAGVYHYYISGQCYDGSPIQLKGELILVR